MSGEISVKGPGSVNELQRRIGRLARERGSTVKRLQSLVAGVVVCQVLPDSAVKGGTGLKLRFGDSFTRQTTDLDTAFRGDLAAFAHELAGNLAVGWGGFTGSVALGRPRPPEGVPEAYVMQPYTVKLAFQRRAFATVVVEVGFDELEATVEDPELKLSAEVIDVFAALGLDAPAAIRVLPLHHQVAQKLHACTEPGNERAHDLVDLQLIAPRVDVGLVASTTRRLFAFRRQHQWPAVVVGGQTWPSLYVDAAQGLPVLGDVDEAIVWANDYIAVLDRSVPDG